MADLPHSCPHCGTRLTKWRVPDEATWPEEFFFVCFDDECSYYKKGWVWMEEQYGQKASFRYAINPTNGNAIPLPVWSDQATREMIVEDNEGDDR